MKKNLILLIVGFCLLGLSNSSSANTWYSYNGHEYAITNTFGNWGDCEAEAVSQGGHLVAINDQAEQDWLNTTFGISPTTPGERYFIGLYQENKTDEPYGNWVWISGEPVIYTNWIPGEPNDSGGIEDWVHMAFWPHIAPQYWGMWNDGGVYGGGGLRAIIERPLVIPIPSTILLLGAGLCGIGFYRRRKYTAKN